MFYLQTSQPGRKFQDITIQKCGKWDAKFLTVWLSVENRDTKERIIPPFTLIDDSGAEYTASNGVLVEGAIGTLHSLNPNVSKSGFIFFDVPQGRRYRLKLSGGFWSLQDAYVRLLPQANAEDAMKAAKQRPNKLEGVLEKLQEARRLIDESTEHTPSEPIVHKDDETSLAEVHVNPTKYLGKEIIICGGVGFPTTTIVLVQRELESRRYGLAG